MKKLSFFFIFSVFIFTSCQNSNAKKEEELKRLENELKQKEQVMLDEKKSDLERKARELDEEKRKLDQAGDENIQITNSGIFPFTSTRYLNNIDINGLSSDDLKIMRNEIFARHGYIFKTDDMRQYFSQQSWYNPQYNDVTSMLSAVEKSNVEFIKKFE